jgi:tellurite resistance protein
MNTHTHTHTPARILLQAGVSVCVFFACVFDANAQTAKEKIANAVGERVSLKGVELFGN